MGDQLKSERKEEKYLKWFLEENWEKLSIPKNEVEKVFKESVK
jgi:hypothetical protein